MAEHREVRYERLYVKAPGSDKLRKTATGRMKQLTSAGWRETERTQTPDFIRVRLDRTGQAPLMTKLPKVQPVAARPGRGGPGGPRGGGPRGGPRR